MRNVAVAFACALGLCYAAQMAAPLRLSNDAIELLNMAASAADGNGFPPSRFPIGYPAIIAVLDRAGIARPPVFVALNLCGMALGLGAFYRLFREELGVESAAAGTLCLLASASWVSILLAAIPIAEMCYLATSAVSLWCMCQAQRRGGRGAATWIAGSVIACLASILLRVAGVTLVPALVWSVVRRPAVQRGLARPLVLASIGTLAVAAAAAGCWRVMQTEYFALLAEHVRSDGFAGMLWRNSQWRAAEVSEIFLNVSAEWLPRFLGWDLVLLGVILLAVCGIGLGRHWRSPVAIYVAAYFVMLITWPYPGTRFWLPVLPLLLGFAFLAARRMPLKAYGVAFCLLGSIAMFDTLKAAFKTDRPSANQTRTTAGGVPVARAAFERYRR